MLTYHLGGPVVLTWGQFHMQKDMFEIGNISQGAVS